jgi:serine protease Do
VSGVRRLRTGRLIALISALATTLAAADVLGQAEAEGLSASFRKASRRVLPAVVTVRPIGVPNPLELPQGTPANPFANRPAPREAGGSGVVIDAARGLVLTNDHVVQGATQVVVMLGNGRERPVKQVWRDPKSDLALLSVDPSGLVQADWGDSDSLDTGDWVLAVGQPFGLSGTVTAGIVSGKGRGIGLALYEDLIQTDAAINPGNSGGPLVNLRGEVVGINTAIKTTGGGYEGVGFAVPASRARRVASDLAEFGRVRRAYLGVTIRPVDPSTGEGSTPPGAVVITSVAPASPADEVGLKPGDVILQVDGKPVDGPGPLQSLIEVAKVGEPMNLAIARTGFAAREVVVRPAPQPERYSLPQASQPPGININVPGARINVPGPNINIGPPAQGPVEPEPPLNPGPGPQPIGDPARVPPPVPGDRPTIRSRPAGPGAPGPQETVARSPSRFPELGLRLSEPTPTLIRRFRFDREPRGLIVMGVEPDSPADRGGLEIGMVITDAANRKVTSLPEFREALANRPAGRDLLVRILKGTKAEFRVIFDRTNPTEPGSPEPAGPSTPPESSPRLDPLPRAEGDPPAARVEPPSGPAPPRRPE